MFEALNHRFRVSLSRYFARRISGGRGSHEIDDMVQEVFERLLKRGAVANVQHLSGYVFETASSVLMDRYRRDRSRHTDVHDQFDETAHADVDFSPEHVLIARERLAQVTTILLELPERTRVVFVLRRLEGMKFIDISARLGISVSAVEKHMQRAIAYLLAQAGDGA
jgi:RNA polymerase sigma factor (sigma-70 family)